MHASHRTLAPAAAQLLRITPTVPPAHACERTCVQLWLLCEHAIVRYRIVEAGAEAPHLGAHAQQIQRGQLFEGGARGRRPVRQQPC